MRYVMYLWLVLICTLPSFAAPPAPVGTITLLEGKGLLIRGASRYVLTEGVRVEKGDIVELQEKSFAEVEFGDGTVVAAGPQTRMLLVPVSAKGSGTELFLLQGQAKTTARGTAAFRLTTPVVVVTAANATVVLQGDAAGAALFMERGDAKVQELLGGKVAGNPVLVKNGEFYSRKAEQKSEITPRPLAAFVSGLPRPFLDNLPTRLEKFKDVKVEPKKTENFTYADVEPWLKTTPSVRKFLVPRWQTKARDPVFRKALIANLKEHPEWDRILYPEKYEEAAKKAKEAAARAKAGQQN